MEDHNNQRRDSMDSKPMLTQLQKERLEDPTRYTPCPLAGGALTPNHQKSWLRSVQ